MNKQFFLVGPSPHFFPLVEYDKTSRKQSSNQRSTGGDQQVFKSVITKNKMEIMRPCSNIIIDCIIQFH